MRWYWIFFGKMNFLILLSNIYMYCGYLNLFLARITIMSLLFGKYISSLLYQVNAKIICYSQKCKLVRASAPLKYHCFVHTERVYENDQWIQLAIITPPNPPLPTHAHTPPHSPSPSHCVISICMYVLQPYMAKHKTCIIDCNIWCTQSEPPCTTWNH